jgi:hypothetical protein
MTKECSSCFLIKQETEFNKRFKSKDGLQFICKSCQSDLNKNKYISDKKIGIDKDVKRNQTLKSIKKKLSRAIKVRSNCLIDYIQLDINELIRSFELSGFSYDTYGKRWGIYLIKDISNFTNQYESINYKNLKASLIPQR